MWYEKQDDAQKISKDSCCIDLAVKNMPVTFPEGVTADPDLEDVCRGLLEKDPRIRLGSENPNEIRQHTYFKNAKIGLIEMEQVPPPFIPGKDINTQSQQDIGEFDEDTSKVTDDDDSALQSWNFVSSSAFNREVIAFLENRELQELDSATTPEKNGSCCIVC
uniref:AGC-kinase C-terminal domain-containing protein n=1 Tax=Octactis speculum TaxID=3111310 RepID=A0A7S2GEB2_9STRA